MMPEDQLTRVSGLNQTLQGINSLIAPPVGALLIGILPTQRILLIDVGTALLAIIPLFFVSIPQPVRHDPVNEEKPSLMQDIREALAYIRSWPGLVAILFMALFFKFSAHANRRTPAIACDKTFQQGRARTWFHQFRRRGWHHRGRNPPERVGRLQEKNCHLNGGYRWAWHCGDAPGSRANQFVFIGGDRNLPNRICNPNHQWPHWRVGAIGHSPRYARAG